MNSRLHLWWRQRLWWLLYALFAVLFGLYLGLNELLSRQSSHRPIAYWKPLVWETTSVGVMMALVPAIVWLERRYRLDGPHRLQTIAAHSFGAIVFSLAHLAGMIAARKMLYALHSESYDYGNLWLGIVYEFQKDLISYVTILLIVFALREYRRRRAGELQAAQLALAASDARLRELTAQIDPHFMFNTLNAISNRMHEDVEAADRMMSQLADLLRAAYETSDEILVPLGREIEWLRGYLALMAERYRGQLAIELDVGADLERLRIPRLLIQPLVENALKHGLAGRRGAVRITLQRTSGRLVCTVMDNGVGLVEAARFGTGLTNVTRRLDLLFPGDHELSIVPASGGGTAVRLAFPAIDG